MKRRSLLFVVFVVNIAISTAANDGGCQIDAPAIDWDSNLYYSDETVDDTKLEKTLTYTGALAIASLDSEYIDVVAENGFLTFKGNDKFANIDLNTAKQDSDLISIQAEVVLTCDQGNSKLIFVQQVRDTNNHPPNFLKDSYALVVPMPILPRIDISTLGDGDIIAEDLDFSNQAMTFSIEPSGDFELKSIPVGNTKTYRTTLTATKVIRLSKATEYTIKATDSGKPNTKSGTATLTVSVDTQNSIPEVPSFAKPLFNFDYSESEGNPVLTPKDGSIVINTDAPDDIELTLEANDYVVATFDTASKEVNIKGTKTVDDDSLYVIHLELSANLKGATESAKTVVLINIPAKDSSVPQFGEPYYTATYSTATNPNTVTVDGQITVTNNPDKVTVGLSGENSDNFKLTKTADAKWDLSLIDNLPSEILEKGKQIFLVLEATGENSAKGFGSLIITLPEVVDIPRFSKAQYTATYSRVDDDTATVTLDNGPIEIVSSVDDSLAVTLTGDYANNFQIDYDNANQQIIVKQLLSNDVLTSEQEIILILQATLNGAPDIGSSTVSVKLPAIEVPKFKQSSYAAKYVKSSEGLDTVQLDDAITFESSGNPSVIITGTSSDSFQIVFDNNNYQIQVVKNLDGDILKNNANIILTLEATLEPAEEKGIATVVVTLPSTIPVQFAKPYFSANYVIGDSETDPDLVEITDGPISVASDNIDETSVQVTGQYADYFSIQRDAGTTIYTLKLTKNFESDVLDENHQVTITLEAKLAEAVDNAAVIIAIPDKDEVAAPKFSSVLYTAQYKITDGTHSIALDPEDQEITVKTENSAKTTVILTGKYSENFEVALQDDHYTISIKTNLDDLVLNSQSHIILSLDASTNGAQEHGLANLDINLPQATTNVIPTFSSSYYTASYSIVDNNQDSVVVTSDPITIISDLADQTVVKVIGTYSNNFEAQKQEDDWQLIVTQDLDDSTLKEQQIFVTLEATLDGTSSKGSSAVAVKLPNSLGLVPKFSQIFYTAAYSINSDGTDTITSEQISVSENPETVQITGSYADYFEVSCDSRNCLITVIKDLPDDVIKSQYEILISLEATKTGVLEVGTATVLINLPLKDALDVPQFAESFYTATYTQNKGSDDTVELDNGPIKIKGIEDATKVTVTLSGDNSDHFKIIPSDDHWEFSWMSDLPADVLDSTSSLILEMLAQQGDSPNHGLGVLVVELPKNVESNSISFSADVYYVDYQKASNNGKDTITTTDISITGENLDQVAVTNDGDQTEHFDVSYDGSTGKVTVTLKTNLPTDILNSESVVTINLKATQESTSTEITAALVVKLPPRVVNSPIQFSDIAYYVDYEKASNNGKDTITTTDISITGENLDQVAITIDGDQTEHFDVSYDGSTGKVTVTLNANLPTDILNSESVVTINLKATQESTSTEITAALVVKLPPRVVNSPIQFSDNAYYVVYQKDSNNGKDTITTTDISITGENLDQVAITIDGDQTEHFDVSYDGSTGKVTVTLKTNLPTDVLNSESVVTINLKATQESTSTEMIAALVVKLPPRVVNSPIQFSDIAYYVDYEKASNNGKDTITTTDISITGENLDKVAITIDGDQTEHFDVSYDGSTGKVTVTLNANLPTDILNSESVVTINLKATQESTSTEITAALVVKLPPRVVNSPIQFSDNAYYVVYQKDSNNGKDTITTTDISITGENLDQVAITIDGDQTEHFDVSYDGSTGKVTVTLKTNLPTDVLNSESVVTINLKATQESTSTEMIAALVVKLPPRVVNSPIQFSDIAYYVDYEKASNNGKDTITTTDISITGENLDKVAITIDGDQTEHFDVSYDGSTGKVTVTLNANLPTDILNSESVVTINLKATQESTSTEITAALVVKLPPRVVNSPIQFSDNAYYVVYQKDSNNGKDTITTTDISITGENLDQVAITIDGDQTEHFDVSYDGSTGKVTVTLKTNLPTDVLNSESVVTINLKATQESTSTEMIAALVVKLPPRVVNSPIQFSDNAYYVVYQKDSNNGKDTITTTDISITGENLDQVAITSDGDQTEHFDVSYDGSTGKVTVTLNTNLPTDVLNSESVVTINLKATQESTDITAALVVKLPPRVVNSPIEFSNNAYYVDYQKASNNGKDTITTTDISITGENLDQVAITIDGDQTEHFDVSYDGSTGKVTVTLKTNLPTDVLNSESVVTINLKATQESTSTEITAALVVKLPPRVVNSPIQFSDNAYYVVYQKDSNNGKDTITTTDISIIGENLDKVAVTNEGDQTEHFDVSYDGSTGKVTVTLKTNLPTDVLNSESVVTINLKATQESTDITAALVVKLPPRVVNSPIEFSNNAYYVDYQKASNNGKDTITTTDISITGENLDQVAITIDGDQTEHFDVSYDGSTGKVTVTLKTNLPTDVLNSESVVTINLKATQESTDITAVLVVKLPPRVVNSPIEFSNNAYYVDYQKASNNGKDTITTTDISITGENLDQVAITIDGDQTEHFDVSYDGSTGKVTVTLKTNLPTDVLNSESVVTINLKATQESTSTEMIAALVVKLPPRVVNSPIQFSDIAYYVDYEKASNNGKDTITTTDIYITGENLDQVAITIDGDQTEHFDVSYDGSTGKVTVTLNANLPTDILNSESVVTINLKATQESTSTEITAALVVKLPPRVVNSPIQFSDNAYYVVYQKDSNNGKDTITTTDISITGENLDQVAITIDGDQTEHFDVSYDGSTGKVTVTLKTNLPTDVLNSESVVTINLKATQESTSTEMIAALVVKLPPRVVNSPIQFSDNAYYVVYQKDSNNGKDTITTTDISITGENLDQVAITIDGDQTEHFDVSYDGSTGKVTVTLKTNLPTDVLNSESVVTINLKATQESTDITAALVVKLPPRVVNSPIEFSNNAYYVDYQKASNNGKDTITTTDISITGENLDQVAITIDGDQTEHFDVSYDGSTGKVTVTLKTNLPTDVLNSESVVTINLKATQESTSTEITAALVVKLPPRVVNSPIQFSDNAYYVVYQKDSDNGKDTITTTDISIIGENLDKVAVTNEGDQTEHFDVSYDGSTGKVTVTLKTNLPTDVLNSESVVTINLKATQESTDITAVLVVKLPPRVVNSPIEFSNNAYYVDYQKASNNGKDTITTTDISITGENLDQVAITIDKDQTEHFDVSYDGSTGKVTVTLNTNLPTDILNSESVVTINLKATQESTSTEITAALVVKLPPRVVNSPIQFSDNAYYVVYQKDSNNGKDTITTTDISITGENLDQVAITIDGDQTEHFDVSYDGSTGKVTVTLKTNLPTDILNSESVVTINLKATQESTSTEITAALVVKLPPRVVNSPIEFSNNAYYADYQKAEDGGTDIIKLSSDIIINGQRGDVKFSKTGDNADHFDIEYDPDTGEVSLSLVKNLPDDLLDGNTIITITLKATIEDTIEKSNVEITADLVIKLPKAPVTKPQNKDDSDNTGLIAAVAVLGVLLVGSLVGSAGFYYYRRKRSNKYAEMDEEVETEPKFTKNPKVSDVHKFDHPTRRPTTGIRYSIQEDDGPSETTTDYDDAKERRKSVAFDEHVEKLEIESVKDDNDESKIDIEDEDDDDDADDESDNNSSDSSSEQTSDL